MTTPAPVLRPLSLESFESSARADLTASDPIARQDRTQSEDQLAAFEQGYQNGWDDCLAAETENQARIGADLAANLADLHLTYAEARGDVLAALAPLFEDIIVQFLPRLAGDALAPVLIDELCDIAKRSVGEEVTLLVAPGVVPALERLIETHTGPAVSLRAEPAFAEGQASLRFGGEEREIDLSSTVDRMAEGIRGFLAGASRPATTGIVAAPPAKETANG